MFMAAMVMPCHSHDGWSQLTVAGRLSDARKSELVTSTAGALPLLQAEAHQCCSTPT
jgi:hypothetical protein